MLFFDFGWPRSKQTLLVLALFVSGVTPRLAVAQAVPSIDSILQDWKQRQEKFQTLSFTWTAQTTYPKGSLPGKMPGLAPTAQGQGPKLTPAEDVTQTERMTLKVKNDWIHYTRDGPQWTPDAEKFLQKRYESSFDGSESKAFYEKSEEDAAVHHLGFVNLDKKSQDVTNYEIWPILFHYRPLHPIIGRFASAEWTILQTGATLRERDCVLLKNIKSSDVEETCWVDTEHRSSILRHVWRWPSGMIQTDVDYREDPLHGWVPSGWKVQKLVPTTGRIDYSSTANVTSAGVNEVIGDEEFRLNFPPGTEVNDAPAKQYYLVKPDGSARLITQEERLRGGTYDDFLITESGKARQVQPAVWGVWRVFLILLCPTLLALVGSYFLWKRLVKTRKIKGNPV